MWFLKLTSGTLGTGGQGGDMLRLANYNSRHTVKIRIHIMTAIKTTIPVGIISWQVTLKITLGICTLETATKNIGIIFKVLHETLKSKIGTFGYDRWKSLNFQLLLTLGTLSLARGNNCSNNPRSSFYLLLLLEANHHSCTVRAEKHINSIYPKESSWLCRQMLKPKLTF